MLNVHRNYKAYLGRNILCNQKLLFYADYEPAHTPPNPIPGDFTTW